MRKDLREYHSTKDLRCSTKGKKRLMKGLTKCLIADLMKDSRNLMMDLAKGKTKRTDQNRVHEGRGRREPELIELEIWLRPGEPGSLINHASPEVVCA